ncbi:MAG TPA: methyltransferase domain-containing protein [Thermoanaerobaculia bacterium]|nr:methyltransferase domain-containing protein [Thermoanaerobaculia bacterium]
MTDERYRGEGEDRGRDEERYGDFFAFAGRSAVLGRIWRGVFGAEYPEELEPFGFVTLSDLGRIRDALAIGHGDLLVDLGCGKGGPGLWVARELGARLVGIDVLAAAVAQARRFARQFELAFPGRFETGSFVHTRLPDASAGAVMSVDSFWMVADPDAALEEVRRVLASRARFVFTTWEPLLSDLRAQLSDHGFEVLAYDETPGWLERQLAVYEQLLASRDELLQEIGAGPASILISEAESVPAILPNTPRVLVVAERASSG